MSKADENLQMYPRIQDPHVKHSDTFNNRSYISIQSKVNSDPLFEKNYIEKLISEGWFKLKNKNDILDDTMKGRHFKYRLNGKSISGVKNGTFRSGGIIIGKNEEDEKYIMYKAYNGCLFPLQLDDILEIYIKQINNDIGIPKQIKNTVKFKRPVKITEYPVLLESPITKEDVVIYYAKDNYSRDRFKMSKKFDYAYRTSDWTFI